MNAHPWSAWGWAIAVLLFVWLAVGIWTGGRY